MSLERSTTQHTQCPRTNHEPPIDSPKGWTNDLPRVQWGMIVLLLGLYTLKNGAGQIRSYVLDGPRSRLSILFACVMDYDVFYTLHYGYSVQGALGKPCCGGAVWTST